MPNLQWITFTGLGESDREFANSTFSSNITEPCRQERAEVVVETATPQPSLATA